MLGPIRFAGLYTLIQGFVSLVAFCASYAAKSRELRLEYPGLSNWDSAFTLILMVYAVIGGVGFYLLREGRLVHRLIMRGDPTTSSSFQGAETAEVRESARKGTGSSKKASTNEKEDP
ncbi:MAG: hypothetical protein AAGA96_06230 [Verrucomicrobiota bacterium]